MNPEEDFRLLQYYVAVMRIAATVMCEIFLLLKPDDGKTIKEQLFDIIPNYSSSRYKKEFTKTDTEKLEKEPVDTFDITLLYKLLQKICGLAASNDSTWNVSGTLENFLKKIKHHRNVIAHEQIFLSSDNIKNKLEELKNLCTEALLAAEQRSRKPVVHALSKMFKDMSDVKHERLNLWAQYKKALTDLRKEKSSVLIKEARRDLEILSKRRKIISPFSWLQETDFPHLDVEPLFTKVEIKSQQGREYLQTEQLLNSNLPDIIIVSGAPGMGKTSLTRFMFQDWISSRCTVLGMENVDLVLPVELRDVSSSNVNDLLKDELLPNLPRYLKSDDIIPTLRDVSLIWILDGYDEASPDRRGIIKEIFVKFPNSRVIITTRTEFTSEIEHIVDTVKKNSVTLIMFGFTRENVELCAEKIIYASTKDDDKTDVLKQSFMKFFHDNESLDIFYIPLFLSTIVLLWMNNKLDVSSVSTISVIYSLLIDIIVNRLLVKESYRTLRKTERMLKKDISTFLDELGKILWIDDYKMSLEEYEVNHLEEKCKELGLPFIDTMSAFFTSYQRRKQTEITTYYVISHRTLKEFLSARSFCNAMIAEGKDVKTTAKAWITHIQDTLKKRGSRRRYAISSSSVTYTGTGEQEVIYQNYVQKLSSFKVCRYMHWGVKHCPRTHAPQHMTNLSCKQTTDKPKTTDYWCFLRDYLSRQVLTYIIGYLNFKTELNSVRAEQLAFLTFRLKIDENSTDSFLDAETKLDHDHFNACFREGVNSPFNMELSKLLKTLPWIICSEKVLTLVQKNLQYVVPNTVIIHICGQQLSETKSFLVFPYRCIYTFKEYGSDIHLDLSHFLGNPLEMEEKSISNCLRMLLDPSCKARLLTLHCPLDGNGVRILDKANDLKELSTRISLDNLQCLAEDIRKLPRLQTLRLAIDQVILDTFAINSVFIPRNNYSRGCLSIDMSRHKFDFSKESLNFVLVVPEFFQVEPEILGKVVGKLCPVPSHIVLLRCSPVPYSCIKWDEEKITAGIEVMHQHVLQIVSYADKVDKIEVVMGEYCGEREKSLPDNFYEKYAKRSKDLLRKHSPQTAFELSIIERPRPSYTLSLMHGRTKTTVHGSHFDSREGNVSYLFPPRVF